jgi:UDP-N-acetylmuramate dehydrogenase
VKRVSAPKSAAGPDLALAPFTTLGIGGPARQLVRGESTAELIEAVRAADAAGRPLVVIGGGSNLLVADEGWDGDAIVIRSSGTHVQVGDGTARVSLKAGVEWDGFVAEAVGEGWSGVECLAGIPGLAGATPVQNVGAYGQEIADTLVEVAGWDRQAGAEFRYSAAECGFGYRTSVFKHTDRYVVTEVTLDLVRADRARPIRYRELAGTLGVPLESTPPLAEVRTAVLALRRRKGMVLDPNDTDTASAGSFFTTPIVDSEQAPADCPRWPEVDGRLKLSAAWLIEQAGFHRGYQRGRARLSTKHTLAVTNAGGATAAEVLALAREVRDGVRARFGIELRPEPRLLGLSL